MNKKTILVVEDEQFLLDAIVKKLELNDFVAVPFTNGEATLDYFKKALNLPDAIWLDYHLPDMNGLMFMAKLKDIKGLEEVPVFVISNSASSENVHSMLALGAKKYMLKADYRLEDIIKNIHEFV